MILPCCGTVHLTYGKLETVERGKPKRWRTSRKVFHQRGLDRFWHWEDQTDNLADGYGQRK